jgi:hypothetical protein
VREREKGRAGTGADWARGKEAGPHAMEGEGGKRPAGLGRAGERGKRERPTGLEPQGRKEREKEKGKVGRAQLEKE